MTSPPRQLKVLAFEGFDGGSHHQVRKSLSANSVHDWTWVTRPGRSWKWRMRTGAIELVEAAHRQGLFEAKPDAIFVTSMVAAGDLRSLLPEALRGCPLVLYMHENQATYPYRSRGRIEEERDHQFALTNLTSIAAADRVLWNSRWNRDSFCSSIRKLIDLAPDGKLNDVNGWIHGKSAICWPPVDRPQRVLHKTPEPDNTGRAAGGQPGKRIVWPHRWEHDKGPEALLRLARFLRHRSPGEYRWVLLGERFRKIPRALEAFLTEFENDIDHAGWVESRDDYWDHLGRCDWVLSTARHEFFGIAVVEAMLAGCLPWLPHRLSYPEIIPTQAWGLSPGRCSAELAAIRESIMRHLDGTHPTQAVGRIDRILAAVADGIPVAALSGPDRR